MLDRIFSILSSTWLIHRDTAISYLPALVAFLNGQEILLQDSESPKAYAVSFSDRGEGNINKVDQCGLDNGNIPENAVAVIPIKGVIVEWKSEWLLECIGNVKSNPSINSVVFMVNSPGGMVSQIDIIASEIKGLGKPSIALISGMACSAAMWLISAMDYRIATSKLDVVGSIGAKVTIDDFSGLLEKVGIKFTDLYATKSILKDKEFRALKENNDPKPITEFVDFINDFFHDSIRKNLGIREDSPVFTGDTYFAEKGIDLGLINEIATSDYAFNYAYQQGLRNKIINQSKNLNF